MGRLHQYGGQLCGGTQSRWEGASHLLELGGRGEVVTGERAEAGVLPPPERLPQQVHNWVRQVRSHYRPLDAGKSLSPPSSPRPLSSSSSLPPNQKGALLCFLSGRTNVIQLDAGKSLSLESRLSQILAECLFGRMASDKFRFHTWKNAWKN